MPLDRPDTSTSLLELAKSYQQARASKEARTPPRNAPNNSSTQPAHLVSLPTIGHTPPGVVKQGGSCSPMTRQGFSSKLTSHSKLVQGRDLLH